MCGICGIYSSSKTEMLDEDILKAMANSMPHRGPDDFGIYLNQSERIGFGFRRLSIIDLKQGHQPMTNEDETIWIVYNGEIYNYQQLRQHLERKGHKFQTNTDTEIIIHAFEEKSEKLLSELRGMFAFAIWDSKKKKLFIARDRIGIKPLYYGTFDGYFIFGSEIKALLEFPLVKRKLCIKGVNNFLTFLAVPPPYTLFEGIYKLPAGCFLTIDDSGNTKINEFWNAVPFKNQNSKFQSENEIIKGIKSLLTEAVYIRRMSDVPIGAFLSGGIDSSTIVAIMNQFMPDKVKTFTVSIKDYDEYNENIYAEMVSNEFNTKHHEVWIDHNDFDEFLRISNSIFDEPLGDPTCIPQHFVSKLMRDEGVIVSLVGEGSDELFAGYDGWWNLINKRSVRWKRFLRLPLALRYTLNFILKIFPDCYYPLNMVSLKEYVQRSVYDKKIFWGGAIGFKEYEKNLLENKGMKSDSVSNRSIVENWYKEIERKQKNSDFLQQMTCLEFKHRLPEILLNRVDKITMANSIEARVPFLDHKFVEYVLPIPLEIKVKNQSKYILKKAIEGLIPDEIIYRKKQGFGVPIKDWFVNDLSNFVEEKIMSSGIREERLFDYSYVKKILGVNRRTQSKLSTHIWLLFSLSNWYDEWISGE